jgi:predicted metallopeptidase
MWKKKKKRVKMEFEKAEDVQETIRLLVEKLPMPHIKVEHVYCIRSQGSSARAYARCWGLSRIFQVAAGFSPTYIIEVISHYYDKLSREEQIKVLIHELMHIPRTFSGALLSHRGAHHRINSREVDKIYRKLSE